MYGKHFAQTYTGSMVGSGAPVFAVWGYIIANLQVSDNSIELNPIILSTIIGEPVETIESAIEKLCSPDPRSRTKDHDGRRLINESPFLYRVVNAEKYNNFKSDNARREYQRQYMKKYREKTCKPNVNGVSLRVNTCEQNVSNTEAEADTTTEAVKKQQTIAISQTAAKSSSDESLFEKPHEFKKPKKPKKEPRYNAIGIFMEVFKNRRHIYPCLGPKEKAMLMQFCDMVDEKIFKQMAIEYFVNPPDAAAKLNFPVWHFYERRNHYKFKAEMAIEEEKDRVESTPVKKEISNDSNSVTLPDSLEAALQRALAKAGIPDATE